LLSNRPFELGIYSFADLTPDPLTGKSISPAERLRNLIETIELADQVGLDVFAVGEHHRPDFVASAPAVILAAAAARTASRTLRGADFVGDPDQVVEKILFQHAIFGHQRLLLQLGVGTIEHKKMLRAVELLGTRVAPVVREEIGRRTDP
jgi:alkanesulfonate monooxygenase SsuD/methylene tetrahydromethanopterin reductase-like flavin-dependent oxidoreductase (luciferase family)